jgi:CheY-like chemotaxis protein
LFGWVVPRRPSPAREAGADHYLVKPISVAALKTALATLDAPPRRILIADDDPEARALLARMLHLLDAASTVTFAASGTEALEQLAAAPCDLLLLDVMMPGLGGLAVLAELRRTPSTRALPVFVVSAQDPYAAPPVCAEMLLAFNPPIPLPQALACTLGVSRVLLTPLAAPRPTPP